MSARGTRSLTNERHVSATTLSLSEIYVQNGIVQASMRDIFEIFLKIADVQTLTWDSQSDAPASQKKNSGANRCRFGIVPPTFGACTLGRYRRLIRLSTKSISSPVEFNLRPN